MDTFILYLVTHGSQLKMNDIDLNFIGPFTFNSSNTVFESNNENKSGIYIWTIKQKIDNTHFIHYIGETKSFANRHKEHLNEILCLNYGIFDPKDAKEGISNFIWKGLWRDKSLDAPLRQLETYKKFHEQILEYISIINIFFAELPENKVDTQLRKHIEGCLGWNLRKIHQEYTSLYPDDCRTARRRNVDHGKLIITVPEIILGLDHIIKY